LSKLRADRLRSANAQRRNRKYEEAKIVGFELTRDRTEFVRKFNGEKSNHKHPRTINTD
jgi:hypothetical protein